MKNVGIYQIKNKINNKSYVGSSSRLKLRWNRHVTDLKCNVHHSLALQRAFHKYGSNNFEFIVLENCEENKLLEREQYYLDNLKPEYNICRIAGNCAGVKHSSETIEKRRNSLINSWEKKDLKTQHSKYGRNKKKEYNKTIREQKEQRNLQIIEDLKSGIRQDIIAEKYNLSTPTITQLKKKYNITTDKAKGERNNFSKLTEKQVKEIKYLLKDKIKQQEIADKYNVKLRTIKAIKSEHNWSHITID